MARAFNGSCYFFLEFLRSSCQTAGEYLALFVYELEKEIRVFVVDVLYAQTFETAVFLLFAGFYRQGSEVTYLVVS